MAFEVDVHMALFVYWYQSRAAALQCGANMKKLYATLCYRRNPTKTLTS